jgi:hypothetical protein
MNPDCNINDPAAFEYLSWVERTAARLGYGPETHCAETPLHPKVRLGRNRALKSYLMTQAQKLFEKLSD